MVADVKSLVELWEQTEIASLEKSSVLVCNDGVTACGFFAALGFVLEKIKLEQRFDVVMAVRCIRNVRPGFITGIDQFEMLYKFAYLEKFDTYGNFK
ncbi:receptor-type tyrosine-protein phosphatase C-like [Neocloeon triangulifer]|uniref:receptor-type tyrosine-protein phosphatase C-like n=1 Tax=Neocloeon triangulifer TaxID=2078957 RepID=UPI00286F71C4|nr:receptor-type tyrosine-protein phosphatase C-like [Neocloeon triangulifer]